MRRPTQSPAARRSNARPHNRPEAAQTRHPGRARKSTFSLIARKPPKVVRGMPPVLVRSESVLPARPVGKRSKPRRRIDVALNIPGAEVRLPSLPAIHFSWRILSGLLFLAAGGLLYYLLGTSTFKVEAVQVAGIERLAETDITQVLQLEEELIFRLTPADLEAELINEFPDLLSVSVQVGLPAEVIVNIVERQPVLAWYESERTMWVDAQGIFFLPRGEAGPLVEVEGIIPTRLPDEEGAAPEPYLEPELVAAIAELGPIAPTRVVYNADHGLGWDDDDRGWRVYFGMNVEQIEMKLQVYNALTDRLDYEGIRPKLISVEYLHAPYYRLER